MWENLFSSGLYRLLGYVFLAVLIVTVLIVISYLTRDKRIARLVYTRSFSEKGVYEGEEVVLTETIYNRNWLPMFFVNVESYLYNDLELEDGGRKDEASLQYLASRFHLMPFMQIRRRHRIRCIKRGIYTVDSVDIYYKRTVTYLSAPATLYVYPRIMEYPDLAAPSSTLQGDCTTQTHLITDPFSVSGIRDYTHGDPFNTINFKASAKNCFFGATSASFLKVNDRDYCSNRTLSVYLNFQQPEGRAIPTETYESAMETGLAYAAAIIRRALYDGYRVGFAANCRLTDGSLSVRFDHQSGELHLLGILRAMAGIAPRAGVSMQSLLDADRAASLRDTEIFFISFPVDADTDRALSQLEMNNRVNVILLNEEGEP